LRDGLPDDGRPSRGLLLRVQPLYHATHSIGPHVAAELRLDHAWVNRRRAKAACLVPAVEFDCEQNVGRL
jgi:hypothetical protein